MTVTRIADIVRDAAPEGSDLRWLEPAHACAGSKFHSPRPLLVRARPLSQVVPGLVGDPDEAPVPLCATCHDNLAVYLSILSAHAGATPQAVRRDFGNQIRALGDRVWADHLKWSLASPV